MGKTEPAHFQHPAKCCGTGFAETVVGNTCLLSSSLVPLRRCSYGYSIGQGQGMLFDELVGNGKLRLAGIHSIRPKGLACDKPASESSALSNVERLRQNSRSSTLAQNRGLYTISSLQTTLIIF